MSHSFETKIVVDPDVPLVRIEREFAAEPARVFQAHVDGELYAKWVGPCDSTVTIEYYDCRNGHTLLTTTSLVDSFTDRDAFVASGMETGVNDGYNALDKLLAG